MRKRQQDGYVLLVILLALSVLVITLAQALPAWKTAIQRERENRTIDHAREYRMAIKRYFHKYGRYPPSIDALYQKDGQGLRYLRQKWPDTLNPKGDGAWEILHYGQAVQAEIVDQPPKAAQNSPGSQITGPGLSGGLGSGSPAQPGQSGMGGMAGGLGGGFGSFGGAGGAGGVTAPPGAGGLSGAPAPGQGSNGSGSGSSESSLGPSATDANSTSSTSGGPVIGVASLDKKAAIHAFNGFDVPNQWQFVYNYAQDPSLVGGGVGAPGGTIGTGSGTGTPAQPPTSAPGTGIGSGSGSGPGTGP